MAKNKRRAAGRTSRTPSGAYPGGPVSSTILLQVPGGGIPWAFIAFLLASASLFALGLILVVLSGRMEVVFNTYLLNNWGELDCGVGGVTVAGARKPSGLLLRELTWVAPAFGISILLAYFFLAALFLLRHTSLSQWISGALGLLAFAGSIVLIIFRQLPALIIVVFGTAVCIVWQIVWFDSRHFSRVVTFAICQIRPWTLIALSFIASLVTALLYAGYLLVLYNLRRIWDVSAPSCTKDRNLYTPRFIAAIILLSATTYWITHVVSSFGHVLGALFTKNHVLLNIQSDSRHSNIRRTAVQTTLRLTYSSVCFGAGLLSFSVFLKDLGMASGQNISLTPDSSLHSTTGALLLTLLVYLTPFHAALDSKHSDWTFSMMALDSTTYWQANKSGVALMSVAGLDILKESGLFQMISYFPVVIGLISALSTFFLVTLKPGPVVETKDLLIAEVLVAFGFFGGAQIARAAFAPFKGAMCTIFVMMARDPAVFQEHYGQIWTRLEELHSGVAEALLK
ncbi:uncharacterized protein EAF02_012134 [Botrytis sinoallii]|uniref:uncharacterized protein n=1 Tax=Botrytis sinoallii TaxID=1463999 RepID=UPI001901964F|nr:uncharacterized protein EAF02_012134 [Botrytis sinoallii]KAF7852904.1 hypothetical protein EAF02_012134 [Botrytis sinoallii]